MAAAGVATGAARPEELRGHDLQAGGGVEVERLVGGECGGVTLEDTCVVWTSRIETRGVRHEERRRQWGSWFVLAHEVTFRISMPYGTGPRSIGVPSPFTVATMRNGERAIRRRHCARE